MAQRQMLSVRTNKLYRSLGSGFKLIA